MREPLVKSAARAIEILEIFAGERRRLTLAQLGSLLDYPKSSLSVLLKSLLAQGYLSYLPTDLSYFPTPKVASLGDWIPSAIFGDELLPMLQDLRDATSETVTLSAPAGHQMRCLRVLLGTHRIALQLDEGTSFPIIGSAIGTAYLADMPANECVAFLARAARTGTSPAAIAEAQELVTACRRKGYASVYDRFTEDAGAVAATLPHSQYGDVLVVAVAGLSQRIRQAEGRIAKILAERIARDSSGNRPSAARA
jgi:DNA-binding IclR family transcriptional regulator